MACCFFIVSGSGNGSYDLIRDSTAYVAPEFDEDENDGSQFLNLHYHDDEDQDISGEDQDVEEAEV